MNITPNYYNLPHADFRPFQLDVIQQLERASGNIILEAPTGSGKTAIAYAMAKNARTTALVRTKSLQKQYGEIYGFKELYGKRNYSCIYTFSDNRFASCEECQFKSMYQCPYCSDCLYIKAKRTALGSQSSVLNYAYWLTTNVFARRVETLVMDECHLLPNTVLGFVGVTINEDVQKKYDLPPFITILPRWQDAIQNASVWIKRCIRIVKKIVDTLDLKAEDTENAKDIQEARKALRFLGKLTSLYKNLNDGEDNWYVRSGKDVLYRDGEQVPGFVCKPFTAKYHFPHYFLEAGNRRILMSATVGNPGVLAAELGIEDFTSITIPNQFPARDRPIFDLGAPSMSYRSRPIDYVNQAVVIKNAIDSLNPAWSGIIHVNSMRQADDLAQRLGSLGLGDRIWVTPRGLGTNVALQHWGNRKQKKRNSIMIAWSMWEGVDLFDENICIVAKVPWESLGDEYARMKMNRNQDYYRLETAWKIVQGLGRIRRGRPQDYVRGNNFVAIADSTYKKLLPFMSESIKESLEVL